MSLGLSPALMPALSRRLEARVRDRAGSIARAEIRRGAENVTIARVAGASDLVVTLKVFSDKTGERIVVVRKNDRGRGGKKGSR